MESWLQELKYAVRSFAGAKRFAFVVIAILALGIGANTAVFGVLHALVLRPLPYQEPERLVRLYKWSGGENAYLPAPAFVEFRQRSRTTDVAAVYTYAPEGADLTDRSRPERVRMTRVSANYFRVLRVEPRLGAAFAQDDERDASRVAVISHRIWQEYLGGAADAIGRTVSLNGLPYRVAAVLPDGFDDPLLPGIEVWTTLGLRTGERGFHWGNHYLSAIGRLKPGVTLADAQAELSTMALGMEWNTPTTRERASARVAALQEDTVGAAGPMLWLLLGAVGLLLLIACVNVASLFLARGAARESELAIRAALGCSRWRLTRQLLVESVVLSMAGGLAGLGLAHLVTLALLSVAPVAIAQTAATGTTATLDRTVLAFSIGVALLAGIGFGIAPALRLTKTGLEGVLRESARGGSGSARHTRARNVLVVCQVALALVLLIAAGLLLRSVERLQSVSLGVQVANVLAFEVHLPLGRYEDPQSRARFHRDFQARIAALPGVRGAAAVSRLPVTGTYHTWGTHRADQPEGRGIGPDQRTIEGRYFEALRIPVLRGRVFGEQDDETAPRRVVVSQSVARQLFGDDDPIGRQLRISGDTVEIIGVVGEVAVGPRAPLRPTVYHLHRQFAANRNWALTQVVALDRPLPSVLDQIRRELAAIDPALVLYQPRMLADVIGGGIAQERFALRLIAAFAGLALVLAAVGLYGVLTYTVARRRREMGIRLALGAPAGAVWSLIVRDGGRLAIAGVAIGLLGAFAVTRALRALLYDVSATDPLVFAGAAIALVLVALAASWLPARAATRIDPLQSVRAEP